MIFPLASNVLPIELVAPVKSGSPVAVVPSYTLNISCVLSFAQVVVPSEVTHAENA